MRNVRYLLDRSLWQEKNINGEDYTPAYIPALCAYMGITAIPCAPEEVTALGDQDVLLIGASWSDILPPQVGAVIRLGGDTMATRSPDIQAWVVTNDGERLPLFAPVTPTAEGEPLLWAETPNGRVPALVKRSEREWDFCFDLPATVWFSGDGFPKGEPQNGFSMGRSPDTRPFPVGVDAPIPYNDRLLNILEDILREVGVPTVHRLPPTSDLTIPDFALHVSGDDEHTSWELDLEAATVMHRSGIPYHLNAMPLNGDFVLDKEKIAALSALDCEVALHTNYLDSPYTLEEQARQCRLFEEQLGYTTVSNTNHCFIQEGTNTERLGWLEACGVLGDNCKIGAADPQDINAFNLRDYAFGTAFPRFTCHDAAHQNRLMDIVEIPVNYYEPRLNDGGYNHPQRITDYIDEAAAHGQPVQLFIHPHYLVGDGLHTQWTLAALRLVKQHWAEKGYLPLLTSSDRLTRFWHERAKATVSAEGDTVRVSSPCPMVLRWPWETDAVRIDGKTVAPVKKILDGHCACLVALPAGEHTVTAV